MNIRTYCRVSAIIFVLVALAHLARLIYSSSIIIDGETIPMFVSWIGFVVPGALAYWGFQGAQSAAGSGG